MTITITLWGFFKALLILCGLVYVGVTAYIFHGERRGGSFFSVKFGWVSFLWPFILFALFLPRKRK